MPRGKRDPVPLSHAELPGADGEGPRSSGEGRRSTSEEEGHLPCLPRDDLAKSMSGSSVSSYHSALCSEGTETFKDCLEFLDEEGTPTWDAGRRGGRAEGAAPGRWAPTGAPGVPPPPGPLARPQRAQLSLAAKNSPGQGGRMGPLGGDRQPVTAAAAGGEPALPRQPGGMLGGAPSDSDEADGEVRALTARAFRSLSGPPGARLDMCSSHTSSSLSNSLSEDGGRPRRWTAAGGEPRGAAAAVHGRAGWPLAAGADGELLGLLSKEQFECVDVELESGEARKGHGKKRTVPKRQILLKRKERKETGFGPRGDGPAPQPLPPARKEPLSKGRAVGEDFRLNYKQFVKTASLDADAGKTRAASCLVKNVLAKKMQYEQRIKMEQKGLRGSSTSSGPSSAGTDLLGDGLEGKSSSLSRSDCSFSAEELRGGGMPVAAAAAGDATATATATHPAKGVVLSEATRESVCKLKTTFNELNQRMKYREVLEGHRPPGAAEEPASERTCYRRARALFEAHPGVGKALDVAPRFERALKPWPSLKQRAIHPSHPQTLPFEADSPALPAAPPCRLFTSRAQEVRLVPRSRQEEKPPAAPRQPPSPGTPARGSAPATPPEPEEKGKGRIPQPRDVRKLVKSSYSLCFGTVGASRGTAAPASGGEPPPATPLVIHCTSVCRREPSTEPGDEEVLAAAGREPAAACAEGPAKLPGGRPSPARGSPVHITRVQATRRGAAAAEGPPASPPRRERSELRVPPRAARVAEGVPHVETHLHVLVGRRSPAAAREGSPSRSGAVLRAEKTVLLPPPPPSPAEGKEGRGRGGTGELHAAEGPESAVQRHGDGGDPQAGPLAGSSAYPQPVKPAAGSVPEPPTSERRQKQPGSRPVSAGSGGSVGGTSPAAPFRAGEGGEGPSGRLPERREAWEHLPKWPAATEPYIPAAPAENSNYLAIPVKAPKSSPMPKPPSAPNPAGAPFGTPSVPNPASTSFGTPSVPNPASTSFGTPAVPNPASTSFGTPLVPNPASVSFGTPSVPNPASTSFGTPAVPNPASTSFGTPAVPNPASTSFGTPAVPNLASTSFGTPAVPNPASTSFGTPAVPNLASTSFGTPLVPNPASTSFGTPAVPNLASTSFGTPAVPNPASAYFGTPLVPNPASTTFGTPTVPNMTNSSFGFPLASSLASTSFGSPLVSNPTNKSFGTPLIPYAASASFGTPLVPNLCGTAFGTPSVPNPSSESFGTPSVPNPANSSLGIPLAPNPASSSFRSPLVTNRVPTSLGHQSVSSVASSSFGSPLVPNPAGAPLGTGACPLPGGEVPWSKPGPEPTLPQPPEGPAAAERPVPLPPAQPQPRLEDAPHFLRRTDGASPSSKSTPSPTKPFAPHLPVHRRMLVDPDSGKCYYMEPPRQPQLKTLYDPETGQYLEVLIPPVASHAGLYQAPFNPLVMAPGVYGPPYLPYGGFPGLLAPSAPSPAHPDLPAAENPSFSGTFSSAPKGEGPPTAGGPDCGYLESLYYIPTGMRASPGPGPGQAPARASPAGAEKGPLLQM
ncbi:proline-rich basic protein 1 [Aquila chrysaetos chrysaetos]|uniref:proline-rich basic protein 1 n=1 Tax=Aquila chrysaetos chrysaetos TaxID=223781 RepID=UPI00117724E7|nr:proline-rich basic protein 1 [Aquila chrysaetos chrysaetos]